MKKYNVLGIFLILITILSGCSQSQSGRNHQTSVPSSQAQSTQQRSGLKNNLRDHINARKRLVYNASKALGSRYRFGGKNPRNGFDCSGLMHYVYKQSLGIDIPRTAAAQRNHSRTIRYAQLQAGDLLFFKTGKRTNHVGIYIGNRQFIHASSGKRRVMVAKMDSDYWYRHFVKFGSYLNE